VLVRASRSRSGKEEWLLLHKRDGYAVDSWRAEDHPRSVLTGRTNDQVKADPDLMWRSDLPAARAAVPLKPSWVAVDPPAAAALTRCADRRRMVSPRAQKSTFRIDVPAVPDLAGWLGATVQP
jgi:bifunctional non-homologous end joining protein LigD